MGKELSQLHYVSCPDCHTMFKPRQIPKKPTDLITCVCCHHIFTLDQSLIYSSNKTLPPKKDKLKSKKQLSVTVDVKSNNTDQYLKKYRLKSKLLLLSWISMPLLIAGLLTSSVYQYKDELGQNIKWRPYVEQFCSILSCELATFKNLDFVLVEDNAMVTVPNQASSIQLFAMLKNIGKFDQDYPQLKINFTDINGQLIDQKIIDPSNYLTNDYQLKNKEFNKHLLAKNSQQYISLMVPDPGQAAVNYEIILQ